MQKWEMFEENAVAFLNENVSIDNVRFEATKGSDSTCSDIPIFYGGKMLFHIEAKLSPAQCAQFAIEKINGKFEFSGGNKNERNAYSKRIIEHMNENKKKYSTIGTTAVELVCEKEIELGWILSCLKAKGVRFVIVSDSHKDFDKNFIKIFEIEEFKDNFDFNVVCRIKRSGSGQMPKKDKDEVEKLLKKRFGKCFSLSDEGKVIFKKIEPEKEKLSNKFQLSIKEGGYRIRKLNSTLEPNVTVIFTLKYIGEKKTSGLNLLTREIEKTIKLVNANSR